MVRESHDQSLPRLAGNLVKVGRHKEKRNHALKLTGEAQAHTSQPKPTSLSPNSILQPNVSEIRQPWCLTQKSP